MDLDSQRTPRTNMMDRTHMSMSVANTPYHSEAEGALNDISYVSDGGVFGSYTGGFNVDSGGGRRLPPGRMQTPFSRKSRLGYADEDEDDLFCAWCIHHDGSPRISMNGCIPL